MLLAVRAQRAEDRAHPIAYVSECFDGNVAAVESMLEPRAQPIVFTKRPPAALFDPEVLTGFAGTYEGDQEPDASMGAL